MYGRVSAVSVGTLLSVAVAVSVSGPTAAQLRSRTFDAGGAVNTGVSSSSTSAVCNSGQQLVAAPDGEAIVHLLNRAAFGPTAELVEHVRCVGLDAWVEEQLYPADIDDPELSARLALYPALEMSTAELLVNFPRPEPGMPRDPDTSPQRILAELSAALVTRAVHARAQLQEVLVDFWLNHFNVFAATGPTRWTIMAYERDAIRPHVLGRFEDLVRASAESAAMLYYLDNYLNAAEGSRGPANGINENYARELMELHTLGVDGGYAQDDVIAVARAFTGWTITRPQLGTIDFFYFPGWHDSEPKTVLDFPIFPGGIEEGRQVIQLLASHPSTAEFIATKLVRRFVSDDPPMSLVTAARDTFLATDGDLRAVMRVILTADEFYDSRYRGAKVKTPFELVTSSLRAVDADVVAGVPAARLIRDLGQPILLAPPPTGWPELADAVVSSGGMLSRFKAGYRIAAGRLEGVQVDVEAWEYLTASRRGPDRLLQRIVQRPVSIDTRLAVREARRQGADPVMLATLALACPEFQQQ